MDEFDDEFTTALSIDAESVPEALATAVKNVLVSLETKDHGYEHGDEVGHLLADGYKVVIYINESKFLN